MLDETNFPCLKIAATIQDKQSQTDYILHMAKSVHVDLETVRLYFLIKNQPGSSMRLDKEIAERDIDREFTCYQAPVCTGLLKEFPETFSKICCLCRYSPKYTNSKVEIEEAILTALLSNPAQENIDEVMILKPCNFKSQFAFAVEDQIHIYPLYQLLFRFIRGSSCSLIIPDNPLLNNINVPNWQRIINTFMTSATFRKAINTQALKISTRDELIIEITNTLLRLKPNALLNVNPDHVKELNKRRKYIPLAFGTDASHGVQKSMTVNPLSANPPAALVAPPQEISKSEAPCSNDGITLEDGSKLSIKALEGLCSPLVAPRYKNTPEHFDSGLLKTPAGPLEIPEPEAPTAAPTRSEETPERSEPLFDENGLFDISDLYQRHEIIPFSSDMISDVLYDTCVQKSFVIDCAVNGGQIGIIFYVPGYGAPVWGHAEDLYFLVKNIVSDREILSYTWNMPELVALCGRCGITNFSGLFSLTSVFNASCNEPVLYPIDGLLSMSNRNIESSDSRFYIHFLSIYPKLYKELLKEAVRKSGAKGIRLWRSYEIALATSIYLWPHFALPTRNLKRCSLSECKFLYTPLIRKNKKGSIIDITITLGNDEELPRYQQDELLLVNILGSIFLTSELTRYETRLFTHSKENIILYVNLKDKHELSCLEEYIALIIAHRFRDSHYSPPKITFSGK